MNRKHTNGPTPRCLPPFLLALCCVTTVYAPAVSAQPYGLRSSNWTGAYGDESWFDCRNWDNAAPDQYTAVTVDGAAQITNNGDHKARAATLTIDTANAGLLTIDVGGELEITAATNTPANTRRYDEWTWLTSHNAHTALDYNVIYAQQSSSLYSQLEDGARALMIDVYGWGGVNDEDLYLCHRSCAIPFVNPNNLGPGSGAAAIVAILAALPACIAAPLVGCVLPLGILGAYELADTSARMKLEDGLDEIRLFLESDLSAIVTIFIEDADAPDDDIRRRFIDAGLTAYMYDPAVDGLDGTTGCWPSTGWMVENNKRLVVFVQSSTADLAGKLLGQFAYTVENTYDIGIGEANYDPTCEKRGESQPLNDRSRKLFVMNHFASMTLPTEFTIFSDFDSPFDGIDFDGSGSPNHYDRLLDRVDGECLTASQRYPNFITPDFFTSPAHGPGDVVDELNSRWRPDSEEPGYNVPP